jgi:phosphate transport system permease protein
MSTASTAATHGTVRLALQGRRADVRGRLFQAALLLMLLLSVAVLVALLVRVVSDAWPVLSERSLDFLRSNTSSIDSRAGVRQGLLGSFILIGFVAVVALPLGVAAAIYIEEYAADTRLNRLLITNIRNLAGVPSIVYGILGLAFIVRGLGVGRVLMAGALILTLLVLPTIIIAAREAIRAVPDSIRQGGYALGATQWQVIWRQVLPAAIPGIATGSILSLSRAIGETAPLLLIGALQYVAFDPSIFGAFTALPVQIYIWTKLPQDDFKLLAAAAIIVLLLILLTLNAFAIFLRNRYQRKW